MTKQFGLRNGPGGAGGGGVAPGVIKTRLSELLWKSDEQAAGDNHPMRHLGESQDVAGAVVFLCSEQASWITRVTLDVDDGLTNTTGYL